MSLSSKKNATMKEEKKEQKEKNEYNIEINSQETHQKTIFDLNKIFHIDLSYNFDLLKNLLLTIIQNQKLRDDKISNLEKKFIDFKNSVQKTIEEKDKLEVFKPDEMKYEMSSFLSEEDALQKKIRPPPNQIHIEESQKNDPVLNLVIVSYIKIIFFRKK